jgi:hypothetical protein
MQTHLWTEWSYRPSPEEEIITLIRCHFDYQKLAFISEIPGSFNFINRVMQYTTLTYLKKN